MKNIMQSSRAIWILLVGLFISSCATQSGSGHIDSKAYADLSDTVITLSESKSLFYEVRAINNKHVVNSSHSTRKRSFKHSFNMNPNAITHKIPAQKNTIHAGIFTYHKADLFGLGDANYSLTGALTLIAEPNGRYTINGIINDRYSLLWIEDQTSGLIVSDVLRSPAATEEDIKKVISEKIAQHNAMLKTKAEQEQANKAQLEQALTFANTGQCEGKNTTEKPLSVYLYAKALFEHKYHKQAFSCFLNISGHKDAPADTFKYLSLMYDIGLGTPADVEKSNYWMEKYNTLNTVPKD